MNEPPRDDSENSNMSEYSEGESKTRPQGRNDRAIVYRRYRALEVETSGRYLKPKRPLKVLSERKLANKGRLIPLGSCEGYLDWAANAASNFQERRVQ